MTKQKKFYNFTFFCKNWVLTDTHDCGIIIQEAAMIARIRDGKGHYDSAVFEILDHDSYAEALVFDRDKLCLKHKSFFTKTARGTRLDVFIFDLKTENWVKKDKSEGYEWLLGREIDQTVLNRCKDIQAKIKVPEWFEIKNNDDVEGLINAATGLHDAYVKKIYKRGEKLFIRFAAWSCEVLFELTGNPETNLVEGYGNMHIGDEYPLILETGVFFEDGKICWTDFEGTQSFAERDKYGCAYFEAEKIRWKFTLTSTG